MRSCIIGFVQYTEMNKASLNRIPTGTANNGCLFISHTTNDKALIKCKGEKCMHVSYKTPKLLTSIYPLAYLRIELKLVYLL